MDFVKKNPPEFVEQFELTFKILYRANITFNDNETNGTIRNLKNFIQALLIVLHSISMVIHIRTLFIGGGATPQEIAQTIPVYFIIMQTILKLGIMLRRRTDTETLLNGLGITWRTTNLTEKQIQYRTRFMNNLKLCIKIYYYTTMLGCFEHIITPLCFMLLRTLILNHKLEMVLPYECIYPFDPLTNWFIYLGTYAFQTIISYRVVFAYIGSELLMIICCANLVTAFVILREDLVRIQTTTNNDVNDDSAIELNTNNESYKCISIQTFIREHQNLIRLANHLDDIFNKIIFFNILSVTMIICLFGFALWIGQGMVDVLNNAIGIGAILTPVFLYCYYGDLLIEESLGIADSAYENLWYNGDVKYQKMILLIIIRSQRPCCLSVLKHAPVSLNMFSKVLSTTWSYFSLVSSIYSED